MNRDQGFFITFEGGEGVGKTTQIDLLARDLINSGYEIEITREPGGTKIGQDIRQILLDPANNNMDPLTEILLYAADRAQDIKEKIKPALKADKIVLADRFVDSNIAYQGYGRGIDRDKIIQINTWFIKDCWPDLTFILDIDVIKGLERARGTNGEGDRLEREVIEFHQRLRQGFLEMAEQDQRFVVLNANCSIELLHQKILKHVKERFP